jgi:hypothetical protein
MNKIKIEIGEPLKRIKSENYGKNVKPTLMNYSMNSST